MMMKFKVFVGMAAAIASIFARGAVYEIRTQAAPETASVIVTEEAAEEAPEEDLFYAEGETEAV